MEFIHFYADDFLSNLTFIEFKVSCAKEYILNKNILHSLSKLFWQRYVLQLIGRLTSTACEDLY